jgi:hypothetical protein
MNSITQQALATELTDILLEVPGPTSSLLFLKGFWYNAVREWNGIDSPLRYATARYAEPQSFTHFCLYMSGPTHKIADHLTEI